MLFARAARMMRYDRSLMLLIAAVYLWIGVWANLGHSHAAFRFSAHQAPTLTGSYECAHQDNHSECPACVWTQTTTAVTAPAPVSIVTHAVLTDIFQEIVSKSIQRPRSTSIPRAPPA